MADDPPYSGREQSFVKHFILRKYLERFAHIVGSHWPAITYVDCFSGPWNVQSNDLKDSSFSIALEELRKARTTHAQIGGPLRSIRCLFLEKATGPYERLREFASSVSDAEVKALNVELLDAIPLVLQFIKSGGNDSFPFIFIDPTGWTGLDMASIQPLLQVSPSEVLINFMTDYVRRFIPSEDPPTRDSFQRFFGSDGVPDRLASLSDPQDREDELLTIYAENLRAAGNFKYVCAAIVLYPEIDRSYFHLIYATRHRRGVEVFKAVERQAMDVMEQTRAIAQQKGRIQKTRQPELFEPEWTHQSNRIELLRGRYLDRARHDVESALCREKTLPYDDLFDLATAYPLVWEADLKEWIGGWERAGLLELRNLGNNQRVPQIEKNNLVVWL
jgi:three-Cys-motif partner protein